MKILVKLASQIFKILVRKFGPGFGKQIYLRVLNTCVSFKARFFSPRNTIEKKIITHLLHSNKIINAGYIFYQYLTSGEETYIYFNVEFKWKVHCFIL